MADLRFGATLPILYLSNIYAERYAQSDGHRIEYSIEHEQAIRFDCRLSLPSLIGNSEEFKRRVESVLNHSLRDAMYECAKIAAEIADSGRSADSPLTPPAQRSNDKHDCQHTVKEVEQHEKEGDAF